MGLGNLLLMAVLTEFGGMTAAATSPLWGGVQGMDNEPIGGMAFKLGVTVMAEGFPMTAAALLGFFLGLAVVHTEPVKGVFPAKLVTILTEPSRMAHLTIGGLFPRLLRMLHQPRSTVGTSAGVAVSAEILGVAAGASVLVLANVLFVGFYPL